MHPPRILIVGGGIGGLTLAAALGRRGIPCDLIERTAAWAPVGAGITLGVNATGILKELGLFERALDCSRTIGRAIIADASGRALSSADFAATFSDWGVSLAIHRADLHGVLVGGCDQASIRMGTTLGSIWRNGRVEVTFSDDSEAEYDLVIGADGIRSQVRDLVFGKATPKYSGYACWRFIVRARLEPLAMYEMWGRGKRFGIVPLTDDSVYAFATINTPANSDAMAQIDPADFVNLYSEFGGPASAILSAIRSDTKLIYGDLEQVRLPVWNDGQVVLLGDAAHAMTPNLGQGAAMAMEDALTLAEAIAGGGALRDQLSAWEKRRRRRVDRIQRVSWRQGRLGQLENPALCGYRNLMIRLTPDRLAIESVKRLLLDKG